MPRLHSKSTAERTALTILMRIQANRIRFAEHIMKQLSQTSSGSQNGPRVIFTKKLPSNQIGKQMPIQQPLKIRECSAAKGRSCRLPGSSGSGPEVFQSTPKVASHAAIFRSHKPQGTQHGQHCLEAVQKNG